MSKRMEEILGDFLQKNSPIAPAQIDQLINQLLGARSKADANPTAPREETHRQLVEKLYVKYLGTGEDDPQKKLIRCLLTNLLKLNEHDVAAEIQSLKAQLKITAIDSLPNCSLGNGPLHELHPIATDTVINREIYRFLGPEGIVNVASLQVLTKMKARATQTLFETNFPNQEKQLKIKEGIRNLRLEMTKKRLESGELSQRVNEILRILNVFMQKHSLPGDFLARTLTCAGRYVQDFSFVHNAQGENRRINQPAN